MRGTGVKEWCPIMKMKSESPAAAANSPCEVMSEVLEAVTRSYSFSHLGA